MHNRETPHPEFAKNRNTDEPPLHAQSRPRARTSGGYSAHFSVVSSLCLREPSAMFHVEHLNLLRTTIVSRETSQTLENKGFVSDGAENHYARTVLGGSKRETHAQFIRPPSGVVFGRFRDDQKTLRLEEWSRATCCLARWTKAA